MAMSKFKVTPFNAAMGSNVTVLPIPVGFLNADTLVFTSEKVTTPTGTFDSKDIYTKNLATGEVHVISLGEMGRHQGGVGPVISQDHTKIVFNSATPLTLTEGDQYIDVYVKTVATGEIVRVSTAGDIPLPGGKWDPEPNYQGVLGNYAISPDNSKVAFYGNFPPKPGLDYGVWDIFIRDLNTGAFTRLGLGRLDGVQFQFSADSQKLIYQVGSGVDADIMMKDLSTGVVTEVSASAAGVSGNDHTFWPIVSPAGDKVAFVSNASNLVPGDTSGLDLFVKTLSTGAIEQVGHSSTGAVEYLSQFTPDGSKLLFVSTASDLVPGDTNGSLDLFVKDLETGSIIRLSPNNVEMGAISYISTTLDGSKVAFSINKYDSSYFKQNILIYVADLKGQSLVKVADYTGAIRGLTLSPDATKVFVDTGLSWTTGLPAPNQGVFQIDLTQPGDAPPVAPPSEIWTTGVADGAIGATDPEGGTLKYFLLQGVTYGIFSLQENGSYQYRAPAGFVGDDFIRYKVTDGQTVVESTFSLHVLAAGTPIPTPTPGARPNTAPVADPLAYSKAEDTPIISAFSARDAQNDGVTYRVVEGPQHGTLVLGPKTWDFKYTPDANYNGPDSFKYVAVDSYGAVGAPATVNIQLEAINDAPVATEETFATTGPLTAAVHATDVETAALTYTVYVRPTHGVLALNTDGTFTYQPEDGFGGYDYFQFRASDGKLSSIAGATIKVTASSGSGPGSIPNTPPRANTITLYFNEDQAYKWAFSAKDAENDAVTYSVTEGPQHGTLTFGPKPWDFKYTPDANYNGDDSFKYAATDSHGATGAAATVTLHIQSVPDAPVAQEEARSTIGTLSTAVHATDPDSPVLTYSVFSRPGHGTLTLKSNGLFTYEPDAGFVGYDYFQFQASDGQLSSVAGYTIRVYDGGAAAPRPNTAPVGKELYVTTPEDKVYVAAFFATDAENDPVTYAIVEGPKHGTLTLGPKTWDFKYTPDANFYGEDSFSFVPTDNQGATGAITPVHFRITPVNDAPVALPGVISTTGPVQAAVGGTDIDSASLTFSVTQRPAHGALTFSDDGMFTYIADPGFVGSDYFVFALSDGNSSSTNTMTLRVFGAPDQSVTGGSGDDDLKGGWGGDTLIGLGGNDTLTGDRGNDVLDGGKGDDIMIGGLGDDIYYVDSRADQVRENADEGTDEVRSGLSFTLPNNVENLTLLYADTIWGIGNALANTIVGNSGSNLLKGGGGNDILIGGDGDDVLVGQTGADTLTGGGGADIFQFDSVSEIGSSVETIVDFSTAQGDRIDLRNIDADATLAGDQAFTFIGDALFHKVSGELRVGAAATGYIVQGDINGDGKADFSLLINAPPIAADFLL